MTESTDESGRQHRSDASERAAQEHTGQGTGHVTGHPTQAEQARAAEGGWSSEPAEQSERVHPGGDPDLVGLVQMANAYGLEQRVVLTLAGQVLSGTLVGGKAYFDALATVVQGEDSDETMRGALAASYRKRGADFEGWGAGSKLGDLDPGGPAGKDLPPLPQVVYLHLRDVSVVTSPVADFRLPLWRGRVADVVGWSVG